MKKILLLLLFSITAVFAWAQRPEVKKADLKAEHAAVSALVNKMEKAFIGHDVATLVSYLAEDALVLGSDPSEFFNKKQTEDIWTEMLAQPFTFEFIGEPTVKVAPDGNSAFAVQQYFAPTYSIKIPFRNGYHLIKRNNEWKIFTLNISCIPKNEDFPRLNEVLIK